VTLLAADVGGTNARYQLWRVAAGGAATLSFEKVCARARACVAS
jgi:glucokinase